MNPAVLALAGSALLFAGQVAGRAARDALFLSRFSTDVLPFAMLGASLLSIAAAFGLSAALARRAPARIAPVAFGLNAAAFGLQGLAFSSAPGVVAVALYLQVSAMLPVLASSFWSVINERFDPYAAKRIVPRMAAAGALAGVVGGVAAERIGSLANVGWVLPLLAALSAACAFCLFSMGGPAETAKRRSAAGDGDHPLDLLRSNALLRQMALLIALAAVAENLVEFALMAEASRAIRDPEDLVRFFSAFYVVCGLLSFAFQATVGSTLLRQVGLAGSIAILPGAVALTGVLSLFVGRLWTVVVVRAVENIAWGSAFRSGFELLYTPVSPQVKRRVKPWIDVSIRSGGGMAGALLVLGLLALTPEIPTQVVMALAVAACGAALIGVRRIHASYVSELEGSLRQGVVEFRDEDVLDATTAHTIATSKRGFDRRTLLDQIELARQQHGNPVPAPAPDNPAPRPSSPPTARAAAPAGPDPLLERIVDLSSGDPLRIRRALHARGQAADTGLALRASDQDRRLVAHVIPLLANAELAGDVSNFLRRLAPRCVGQLADGLLDRSEKLAVRLALTRLISGVADRRALDGLWRAMDEPNATLRRACADAAERLVENSDLSIPKDAVHTRIATEVARATHPWSTDGEEIEFVCALLALVHGRRTMAPTLDGLRSPNRAMRGTALEFFESVLPPSTSRALLVQIGMARASDAD